MKIFFATTLLICAISAALPASAQTSRFERLFAVPTIGPSLMRPSLLTGTFASALYLQSNPTFRQAVFQPLTLRDTLISARLEALPFSREAALVREPLYVGERAPDFTLPDQNGKLHQLSDLRGKTVVLSFYPQDFYAMCSSVAVDFDRARPAFDTRNAAVFSVSVQPVRSKHAMASTFGISHHPLLADSDRAVARAYGVLDRSGLAARVTFIIGPEGQILSTSQNKDMRGYVGDVLSTLDEIKARSQRSPVFFLR